MLVILLVMTTDRLVGRPVERGSYSVHLLPCMSLSLLQPSTSLPQFVSMNTRPQTHYSSVGKKENQFPRIEDGVEEFARDQINPSVLITVFCHSRWRYGILYEITLSLLCVLFWWEFLSDSYKSQNISYVPHYIWPLDLIGKTIFKRIRKVCLKGHWRLVLHFC